jgi:hypothetical protein
MSTRYLPKFAVDASPVERLLRVTTDKTRSGHNESAFGVISDRKRHDSGRYTQNIWLKICCPKSAGGWILSTRTTIL